MAIVVTRTRAALVCAAALFVGAPAVAIAGPADPVAVSDASSAGGAEYSMPDGSLVVAVQSDVIGGGIPAVLTANAAGAAQDVAEATGRPTEDISQRSGQESTFALPDGNWAREFSAAPSWVEVTEGTWAPTDTQLRVASDGWIEPGAHVGQVRFNPGGGLATVVVAGVGDSGVTYLVEWDGSTLPAARIDGARVTYQDIVPGVDLVFEVTAAGFEEFFIAQDPAAARAIGALPLKFSVTGGQIVPADGGLVVVDAAGEQVLQLPHPSAWDRIDDLGRANPITRPWSADTMRDPLGDLRAELSGADRKQLDAQVKAHGGDPQFVNGGISIPFDLAGPATRMPIAPVVPEAWLTAPTTTYPVVVDPDQSWNPNLDTWVQYGWSSDQVNSTELKVGSVMSGSTNYIARSYFRWDLTSLHGKDVTSAALYLYDFHAAACASGHPFILYRTNSWINPLVYNSNEPGWWSQQLGWSEAYHGDLCGASGWDGMDVTELAKQYERESGNTHYFGLKIPSYSDVHNWRRFNSANASSNKPYIKVTYNSKPSVPTSIKVGGQALTQNITLTGATPTLQATISDPDAGHVRAVFTIRRNGIVVVDGLLGSDVNLTTGGSSGVSSVDCPYPLFTDDPSAVYTIEVRVLDGRLYGDAATPAYIITGPASPGPGEIPAGDDDETGAVA